MIKGAVAKKNFRQTFGRLRGLWGRAPVRTSQSTKFPKLPRAVNNKNFPACRKQSFSMCSEKMGDGKQKKRKPVN